jgi:hypothetical protein
MDRNDLFKKLFKRCDGIIELRALLDKAKPKIKFIPLNTDWGTIRKQVDKFCKDYKDWNLYFGVTTRDGKGGTKKNVVSIPCVWADIDFKETPEERFKEKLKTFPFKSTITIRSGNGGHLYFLLELPAKQKDGSKIESINQWIASELGGDNVGNIDRILRLPDTVNHKYDHKPLCEIVEINSSSYKLDDFLGRIPESFEKSSSNTSKRPLKQLYEGSKEGSRNNDLARLVGSWVNDKLTFDDCMENARIWNSKNNPPLLEGEIQAVIKSILKKHEQENITINNIEVWQYLIPFDDYSNLPEFPVEAFSPSGRKMVESVAKVNQVDVGLPASIYISVLSTCLSKKAIVDLGTHKEPVNIFTCPILDSGERKTSTMRIITSPIYEYHEKKKDETLEDTEPPTYIVDDITTEALGKLMAENEERMSVVSSEGGIFGIMAGRYNEKGSNFDIYLKGHAGDPWSTHRIGRKSQSMDSPSLTVCLTVQRDVIKEIGRNKGFRGRGLLARFLYCYCKHKVGYRTRQNKTISETILQEYKKRIFKLMDIPLSLQVFKLSPDAQDEWDKFYNNIESEMLPKEPMSGIKDWGSKLPGAVARISGLLHVARYGRKAPDKPISVNIVNGSIAIGNYYREHALATFGLMKEDPQIESAKKILEYLIQHRPDKFKGRDILRHKSVFKSMDVVTPGLKLLVERNYIRGLETKTTTGIGRPEATVYEVNPYIHKE